MKVLAGLRTKDQARAPAVWWFVVRNALMMSGRRGRSGEVDTTEFLRGLARLSIGIDRAPNETTLLTLARRHRLTVYDSAYLELAHRDGLPLASLDGALRKAARASGVALLGG